ncbi:hypothetical protein M9Y10_003874 [Tritrichomonas musculus]|uniref:Uncharacterized protein n=1 Tax=Tritrichomonas musculus TaxID=1915356 RepID=A0ABR2JQH7_9EUKA
MALERLRQKYPEDSKVVETNQANRPIVEYYLNKIHKLDDIFVFLESVLYKSEYSRCQRKEMVQLSIAMNHVRSGSPTTRTQTRSL